MNSLELCIWLNACESFSAALLQNAPSVKNLEEFLDFLKDSGRITQHSYEKLKKLLERLEFF